MSNMTMCAKLRLACKCIELMLAIVCIGLYVNAPITAKGGGVLLPAGTLMTITFGAFVIILVGVVLGFVCGEKVPKKTDLLYTLAGLCLFIASGSVGINHYNHHHVMDGHAHAHANGRATTAFPIEHGSQHGSHGAQFDANESMEMDGMMSYTRIGMACSAIAIINGVVFLVDAMLSYKDVSENYTPH